MKDIEYDSRPYWKSVLAQKSTITDSAGRELVVTGHGVASPIYCTRDYATHRLSICGRKVAA